MSTQFAKSDAVTVARPCPGSQTLLTELLMKNRNQNILQFPTPQEEPFPTTVFFQIGSTRFAIHMHIENLPPAEPRLRLVPKADTTTKHTSSPESTGVSAWSLRFGRLLLFLEPSAAGSLADSAGDLTEPAPRAAM